jgi:hypothetical protein
MPPDINRVRAAACGAGVTVSTYPLPGGQSLATDGFATRGLLCVGRGWRIVGACGSALLVAAMGNSPLAFLAIVPALVALGGTELLAENGIRRASPWVQWVALAAVWTGLALLAAAIVAVAITVFIVVAVLAGLAGSRD